MMYKVFILPHMGLGDTMVLAGLVRYLAASNTHIIYPVKSRYLEATKQLFRGLDTVSLMPVEDDSQVSPAFGADGSVLHHYLREGYTLLPFGLHTGMGMTAWSALHPDFSHRFYIQAGLDHDISYSHFVLWRDPERERCLYDTVVARYGPDYIFLHEDRARGYPIDRSKIPPDIPLFSAHDLEVFSDNIFDYCLVMERARELHFMDSCFGLLADRLPGVTCPMTCHAYARDNTTHPSLYKKAVVMLYTTAGGSSSM
jgi:hypothetical protein